MGRLYVGTGTRYQWDGRTCVVVQVLRDGQVLMEDQSGGGQAVVTRAELTAAWDRGRCVSRCGGQGRALKERGRCRRGTRSRISMWCRRGSGRRRGGGTR